MTAKEKDRLCGCLAIVACLLLSSVSNALAEPFRVLHNFTGAEGGHPQESLLLSGGMLYGTAWSGGSGAGVIYGLGTNGVGYTNVHAFTATSGGSDTFGDSQGTNSDGAQPLALLLAGDTLYGTTGSGGAQASGTLFKVNTNGSNFTVLHTFTNGVDGFAGPDLVMAGNMLYGLCVSEQTNGVEDSIFVYAVDTNGNGFTQIGPAWMDSFVGALALCGDTLCVAVNNEDSQPYYPATLYSFKTNGTDFRTVLALDPIANGSDISAPFMVANDLLYGTAAFGGAGGGGTVYAVDGSGTNFQLLHAFAPGDGDTNGDGASPMGQLALSGDALYGAARGGGGPANNGTIYSVRTNSGSYKTLHLFSSPLSNPAFGNCGGGYPWSQVVVANGELYGTCFYGGPSGYGTIFALNVSTNPIPLQVQLQGGALVLTWASAAFTLEAAPLATGVYTNVPNAFSPFTNSPGGAQMFFRLVAN